MASDKFLKTKSNYKKGIMPGAEQPKPAAQPKMDIKPIRSSAQLVSALGLKQPPTDPIGKALEKERKYKEERKVEEYIKEKHKSKFITPVKADQFWKTKLQNTFNGAPKNNTNIALLPEEHKKLGWYARLLAPKTTQEEINNKNALTMAELKKQEAKELEKLKSKRGSFVGGAVDTASLGLAKYTDDEIIRKKQGLKSAFDISKEANPKTYIGGQAAGYLMPGAAAEKTAGLAFKGTTLSSKLVRGSVAGGGMEATEGLIRGEDAKTIAKRVVLGAGLGAAGEGAAHGIKNIFAKRQLAKDLIKQNEELAKYNNFKANAQNKPLALPAPKQLALPEPAIQQGPIPLRPKTLESKVTPKQLVPPEPTIPVSYRTFTTNSAGKYGEKISKDWSVNLDSKETAALKEYIRGSKGMNAIQRGQNDSIHIPENLDTVNKWKQETIPNLDKALRKGVIPDDITVYRGASPKALGLKKGLFDEITEQELKDSVGKVVTDKGFMSTTLDKKVATEKFDRGIIFEIRVPKGTKGQYVSNQWDGELGEAEVLFPQNSKMRIVDYTKNGHDIKVIAEIVNDADTLVPKQTPIQPKIPNKNPNIVNRLKIEAQAKTPIEPILPKKNPYDVPLQYRRETPNKVLPGELSVKPRAITEPITPNVNGQVAATAENLAPKVEEKIILSNDKKPFSIKDTIEKVYSRVFNDQHLIGKISPEVKMKASNSRQSQGITDFIAENGLADMNGVKVGKSLKELSQELPLEKEEEFWRYMAHKHNVSRAAEGKNVYSQFDSADSLAESQRILAQNPEFEEASKKVTKWINDFMDEWGVKSGLISEETAQLWRATYPDYFPIYRELNELTKGTNKNLPKNSFVNNNNLVKKAKGAKEDLSSNIRNPIGNIAELINKTVKAAKNNEVGVAILKSVRQGGLDDIFEIIPTKEGLVDDINTVLRNEGIEGVMTRFTEQFDDVFKQVEKGNNIVKIMENGKEVLLKVKDVDYLKALQSLSDGTGKSGAEQFERAARKITRPIKDLITGKNPLFAVFNMLRDTPTAFIQGQENNPIKFTMRYFKALKEISSNSKGFQEFVAQGGMQSGFFKSDILKTVDRLKNPNISTFEKFIRKIEAFNNLTEATPRYMEYLATLEKGGTRAEAIYNAAEVTVNFARHGKYGKTLDSVVMYLNPALQGLDKMRRAVQHKPLQTALKGATVITAPQIITDFVNKDNPNYQSLDQRTKDDFFLIPNNFGAKDAQGNPETFFRIPKARQYSVILGVLVNRMGEMAGGKSAKDAMKGVGGSFTRNFSVPTRPFWAPFSDVKANKDWKGAPINPLGMQMDNRPNYLKYDETTSEIGKVLSKLLNEQPFDDLKYSPKDIDYLIDSFTGIIGDLGLPLATKNKSVGDVFKKKFTTDSAYSNQDVTNFYENLGKIRTQATEKNILDKIPGRIKTIDEANRNRLNKLSEDMTKLNEKLRKSTDKEEQRRIRKEMVAIAQKGNALYNGMRK